MLPKDLLRLIASYSNNPDEIIILLSDEMNKEKIYKSLLKERFNNVELFDNIKKSDFSFKLAYNIFAIAEQKTSKKMLDKILEIADLLIYSLLTTGWTERYDKNFGITEDEYSELWNYDIMEEIREKVQFHDIKKEHQIFGIKAFEYRDIMCFSKDEQIDIINEFARNDVSARNTNSKGRNCNLQNYYQSVEKRYIRDVANNFNYQWIYDDFIRLRNTTVYMRFMHIEEKKLYDNENPLSYNEDCVINSFHEFIKIDFKSYDIYPIQVVDYSWINESLTRVLSEPKGKDILYLVFRKWQEMKFATVTFKILVEKSNEPEIRRFIKENQFKMNL